MGSQAASAAGGQIARSAPHARPNSDHALAASITSNASRPKPACCEAIAKRENPPAWRRRSKIPGPPAAQRTPKSASKHVLHEAIRGERSQIRTKTKARASVQARFGASTQAFQQPRTAGDRCRWRRENARIEARMQGRAKIISSARVRDKAVEHGAVTAVARIEVADG